MDFEETIVASLLLYGISQKELVECWHLWESSNYCDLERGGAFSHGGKKLRGISPPRSPAPAPNPGSRNLM